MVDVLGRPLLEHLINGAVAQGLYDFVILTGYLSEVIESWFGDGSAYGAHITYVREDVPRGTAGAILDAEHILKEPFIVLYGDILLDVDLRHIETFHNSHDGIATIFVHPNDHPHDSDLVVVDQDNRISSFLPKPHPANAQLPNLVSAAIYVLSPQALAYCDKDKASDWGADIFPRMVSSGEKILAYRSCEYAKDIGTPERLTKGEGDLKSGRVASLSRRVKKPAVFIDRDGVLNKEIGGVLSKEQMQLLPGTASALKRLNRAGLVAICITNQPELAKGRLCLKGLSEIHAVLDTELAREGAYLDDLFYCPHHPEAGWAGEVRALKIACSCRKPAPGMLHSAAITHNIDLSRSWMIGDRYVDIAAGKAAGARTILVRTGFGGSDTALDNHEPDIIVDDFPTAIDHILKVKNDYI
jgi:histidinol-phosphate phosphatase family protein